MIDMASVYAERFKTNPQALQAAVMGQSPDPKLDPYTALNALKLVKEANMMEMAGKAQQPTSTPSIVAENMAPNPMQQGLGAMVPGAMGQAPQGMPPQGQAPAPRAPVMQAASGGLAGMYTPEEDYAAGGIVAFQAGGETEEDYQRETTDTGYSDAQGRATDAEGNLMEDADAGKGSGSALEKFNTMLLKQAAKIGSNKPVTISPTERKALFKEFLAQETENAGPDIYKEEIARGAQDDADRAKARKVGEANALFTAAGKVLKGNRLATGLSEALPAYGSEMNRVEQADQAAKTANSRAQFALKDAQRKERSGNIRAANTAMESYRKFIQDENKAVFERDRAVADIAAKGIAGNRPLRGAAGDKVSKIPEQLGAAEIAYAQNPTKENLVIVQALRATQDRLAQKQTFSLSDIPKGGAKDTNAQAIITSKENTAAQNALNDFKTYKKTAWKKYVESHGGDEARASQAYKSGWKTTNPNAGSDDFDPAKAADYTPTAAPAGTKPGTVLNYDASGKRIN